MNPLEPLTRWIPASLRRLATAGERDRQMRRLAEVLRVEVGELSAVRLGTRYHYRPFTTAKADGRERRILAPSPPLKGLQRRLLDNYLATLPVSPHATAFRRGGSIVHNARRHANQRLIATVDLRDFFEATKGHRVRRFFARHGWREEALGTLMRLCVFRDGLPQGAPTSPCLSNLVNASLDEALGQVAHDYRAAYTRYGDDLTFSWAQERLPDGFTIAVEECVAAAGYEVQPCKGWQVQRVEEGPCVTGVVLRGKGWVGVPRALRWRAWWLWLRSWSGDEQILAQLRGHRAYARMVR